MVVVDSLLSERVLSYEFNNMSNRESSNVKHNPLDHMDSDWLNLVRIGICTTITFPIFILPSQSLFVTSSGGQNALYLNTLPWPDSQYIIK